MAEVFPRKDNKSIYGTKEPRQPLRNEKGEENNIQVFQINTNIGNRKFSCQLYDSEDRSRNEGGSENAKSKSVMFDQSQNNKDKLVTIYEWQYLNHLYVLDLAQTHNKCLAYNYGDFCYGVNFHVAFIH